jgi:serine/threonine protein kinase
VKTGRPSQKGDVWSLALVLYEAVAGKNLFPLLETEYVDELARLERSGKVKVQTGDDDLDSIIEKCIKVNPDERPSMRELEEMLFAYLERKMGRREKEIKAEFERKIGWLKRRERKERKRERAPEEEETKKVEEKRDIEKKTEIIEIAKQLSSAYDLLIEARKALAAAREELSDAEIRNLEKKLQGQPEEDISSLRQKVADLEKRVEEAERLVRLLEAKAKRVDPEKFSFIP